MSNRPPYRSALQRQWQKKKSVEAVNRHHNHTVFIDWNMKSLSNPALCCAVCNTPAGKRKGKPQFIKWVSDLELEVMRELGVEERNETTSWLDTETANIFKNRINIPIANVEIEAAWEEFNAQQLRQLNKRF